ncbi:unnamed protein product [Parascedosporium putredinis]|uniref:Uncharacterized protein n=1 Tax=Parascedosporium putredinis TaxID=1442378 RepID=A0A9P1HD54_9PEZI|nr:unnamed protein product [Parascedosporium putredinis]CAI8003746.1 unnamed protein product [Parascedosporium putredinis]
MQCTIRGVPKVVPACAKTTTSVPIQDASAPLPLPLPPPRTTPAPCSPPRAPLHHRLREAFAPSSTSSAPDRAASRLDPHLAEQLSVYLRAQRTYGQLLERYNPGMNMEQDERVRLTARKVGMDLPVEFNVGGRRGDAA